MELNRIEIILEKYFKGETSISEELELQKYFSSFNIAQHLEHYTPLFVYFSEAKEQKSLHKLPLQTKKRNVMLLSIAASVLILLGISTFTYFHLPTEKGDLGTYENPEAAFAATQKALTLLSENVNVGIESVEYIYEYEYSKNLIFKNNYNK